MKKTGRELSQALERALFFGGQMRGGVGGSLFAASPNLARVRRQDPDEAWSLLHSVCCLSKEGGGEGWGREEKAERIGVGVGGREAVSQRLRMSVCSVSII